MAFASECSTSNPCGNCCYCDEIISCDEDERPCNEMQPIVDMLEDYGYESYSDDDNDGYYSNYGGWVC